VNNVDDILSVPSVDACFIGPNDLAASMGMGLGVPLESEDPRLVEAIMHIRDACIRNGVATGIHTSGAAAVNMRIKQGFQFCAMASELRYMIGFLKEDLETLDWSSSDRTATVQTEAREAGTTVRY